MKKLLLGTCLLLMAHAVLSQSPLTGKITDSATGAALNGANIEIEGLGNVQTNSSGLFIFPATREGKYHVKVSNVGYRAYDAVMALPGGPLDISLAELPLFLQAVEVKAIRAGEKAPFTKTNISKKEIERINLGQDLPFLLNQTPSVVINSDAGNGVGYTGITIRGTDATRINMTLNGIPYNDAEDQTIYFVDLPDFASSVSSIQVQRGVGTSSNGAGAFGATINFSTNEFNDKPYAEINNSFGSFRTWKNTVKAGSGLIDDHFTLDARVSRITSDGYIDRAASDLKSLYLSAGWYTKKSSIRFNMIFGAEKTYQAWNGIPEAKLNGDKAALDQHYADNLGSLYFTQADSLNLYNSPNRTYNYFTYPNQTDNYWQNHYQLFFNHQFNSDLSVNVAGFLSRGYGYYEEYKNQEAYAAYGLPYHIAGTDTITHTDLIRQLWLDNYFYGGIFSVQYKKKNTQLTAGGGWDRYDGKHYGLVNWTQQGGIANDYTWYNVSAYKTDANFYGKIQQQLNDNWTAFGDLQYRQVNYHIGGFQDNPQLLIDNTYHFVNPKAGITYNRENWLAYFSWSLANHEPNRGDFESATDQQPKPETLNDFELNIGNKNDQYSWAVTGYEMLYHNQLALNGKINTVGEYTRINIPSSYRLGVEIQGTAKFTDWLHGSGNLSFSRNKIKDYTEYIDDYDNGGQQSFFYKHPDIAFSPSVVGGASLDFFPFRHYECSLIAKYVGKEYLDNSQREDRKLNAYYVQDLRMMYTFTGKTMKETNIILQVNNIFNKKYAPNGYTYSYFSGGALITENFLFPMAVTNFMVAVNIKL